MKYYLLAICWISHVLGIAQADIYYIGAGQTDGVTISSSESGFGTSPMSVISGKGMDMDRMQVTRFLAQSTLGYENHHVEEVLEKGMETWIDEQIAMEASYYLPEFQQIYDETERAYWEGTTDEIPAYGPSPRHFNYTWWQINLTNDDLLRHRVTLALSEILVISLNSMLDTYSPDVTNYYDVLVKHAFGNYRDLLLEVTLHPTMGFYLSHFQNPKADPENNIFPDENYAREIMQLFSIGLYELNEDGSRKLDEGGHFIPTYDNDDIREMAKIFTGLAASGWDERQLEYFEENGIPVPDLEFHDGPFDAIAKSIPMTMYIDFHEPGEKTLLKTHLIPAGQDGMKDIEDAIDVLFNHPNVGPFIGRKLIQHFVKSNPSPEYIKRVARVFADNGEGVRGDLGAVVKTILLDEEARSCAWQQDPTHGKLREPVTRMSQLFRILPKDSPLGNYWAFAYGLMMMQNNHPMYSPSVFNFFEPDHIPSTPFGEMGLVGPEFKIHDTQSSTSYLNQVKISVIDEWLMGTAEPQFSAYSPNVAFVLSDVDRFVEDHQDLESVINYIDVMFTHGRLKDSTRNTIREAIRKTGDSLRNQSKLALYLALIAPDYTILK